MTKKPVLILVPAYNEGPGIARVIAGIRGAVPDVPIWVVDDGSGDDTAAQARRAGAEVLSHERNRGYGAALLTGYTHALEQGYERVVQMDADGQHDVSSIASILTALEEGGDLVLGSRFRNPESYRPRTSRLWGIRFFSFLVRRATDLPITDATTGFQGLSRRLLRFYVHRGFPTDYPDANVIIRVARAGYRVEEVAVRMFAATGAASIHRGWRPLLYVVKMLFAIALEWGRRVPMVRDEDEAARR